MLEFTFSWNYRLSKNLCTMVFWEQSEVAKLLIKWQAFGSAVGFLPDHKLSTSLRQSFPAAPRCCSAWFVPAWIKHLDLSACFPVSRG